MKRHRPWLFLIACFFLHSCATPGTDALDATAVVPPPPDGRNIEASSRIAEGLTFSGDPETGASYLFDDFFEDLEHFRIDGTDTPETSAPLSPEETEFYADCSKAFGIRFDGSENRRLLEVVKEWLGIPYRWGGCSESGIDCSCLVKAIFESVYDVPLERTSRDICEENTAPIPRENLQEGDILCFKTRRRSFSHIGIYLKDDKFVHASRTRGVTISSLKSPYFAKRLAKCGRVAGIHAFSIAQVRLHDMTIMP